MNEMWYIQTKYYSALKRSELSNHEKQTQMNITKYKESTWKVHILQQSNHMTLWRGKIMETMKDHHLLRVWEKERWRGTEIIIIMGVKLFCMRL